MAAAPLAGTPALEYTPRVPPQAFRAAAARVARAGARAGADAPTDVAALAALCGAWHAPFWRRCVGMVGRRHGVVRLWTYSVSSHQRAVRVLAQLAPAATRDAARLLRSALAAHAAAVAEEHAAACADPVRAACGPHAVRLPRLVCRGARRRGAPRLGALAADALLAAQAPLPAGSAAAVLHALGGDCWLCRLCDLGRGPFD